MKKFGLEQEFFLVNNTTGEIVIPEDLKLNLPTDSCGYLVEARGKAYNNMYEAVYSLKAEVKRINDLVKNSGYHLGASPFEKLSKAFLFKISRRFIKGLTKYDNLYGFINHKIKSNERTAGLHLSITDQYSLTRDGYTFWYNQNFDYVQIFKKLDKYYKNDIKAAKRNQGFYEIKEDGRIEYRSLPNSIDLDVLINVVNTILK